MSRNVNDIIRRLSSAQRKKVEARAAELIAEEMTLQELRRARKLTQVSVAKALGITQDSVSRLEKRSDILLSTSAQDRSGHGRKPLTRGRISRPCARSPVRHCRNRSGSQANTTQARASVKAEHSHSRSILSPETASLSPRLRAAECSAWFRKVSENTQKVSGFGLFQEVSIHRVRQPHQTSAKIGSGT